jgi:Tol biopolymer transport system component
VLTIRSLETGEERDIKPQLSYFEPMYMAHDGRSIILQGQRKAGARGFYRIDAATGEATPIIERSGTEASSAGNPWYLDFSPDGKTLYYLAHLGTQSLKRILKRNMETGEEREIYRIPDSHRMCMRLSPDGRRLAGIHWKRPLGVNTLFTLGPDGGEPRELLAIKEPEQLAYPGFTWSVDGRYLLFAVRRGQQTELWRIPAEGGQPQNLGIRMEGIHTLSVHPDGRRIAFGGGNIIREVWVLENFLPPLKAAR